jgi:hypothetical protein
MVKLSLLTPKLFTKYNPLAGRMQSFVAQLRDCRSRTDGWSNHSIKVSLTPSHPNPHILTHPAYYLSIFCRFYKKWQKSGRTFLKCIFRIKAFIIGQN